MVTMAQSGSSLLLFNLRKMLNHRIAEVSITTLLAFYVLWQAGSLAWKLWLLTEESPQATALIAVSPGSTEPESLQDLLRHPLIQSASDPATNRSASIDAPETSLNLKLVGLMYSTDKQQARAIIQSEKEGARSYSTRERVADKAEIYRIEPDRVILLHAGQQEALLLDPENTASSAQAGAENQPIDDAGANGSSTELQNVPKRTADLMRDFSATPVMEDGELVGFRLQAVRNPEIMRQWGIDPDDVITAVNGTPLTSQGRIMILYDKLKRRKEFDLTLNSGGSSRTITVDLSE
jgi:general secretion pathway protein C